MHVAHQPAVIHITHDVFDAFERHIDMRRVMHGENDPGDDLDNQADGEDTAKRPPVIQILWRREVDETVIGEPNDRQAPVDPFL